MVWHITNEAGSKSAYAGVESGAVPAAVTHQWRGDLTLTKSANLVRKEEATGGYDRYQTVSLENPTITGTYAESLSYESLASHARFAFKTGNAGVLVAGSTGAYRYRKAPSPNIDDIDSATVVYGVDGLAWQSTGVRHDEWTLTIDADDTEAAWQFSSNLAVSSKDELPPVIDGVLTSTTAVNEVQTVTVTGSPTGGTFTLTYGGQTTAAIAYNATAAAVRTALEALSTIGAGNVATGGGPLPGTAVTVTFQGALGSENVALMTATGSFTGGTTPAITVAETTPGVAGTSITMTGAGWTVNDLIGRYLFLDFGSHTGDVRMITANTADTITVDEAFTTTPVAGDAFRVEANMPVVAIQDDEIIKTSGTEFYIDELGTPLGTTQINERVISFNMTVASNRTTKKFLETPEGQFSRRSGRGARVVTGQIRLELDRRDEYVAWLNKWERGLMVRQTGTVIDSGITREAVIEIPRIAFETPAEDTRENNMTVTVPFVGFLHPTESIFTVDVVNDLVALP